MNLSYTSVAFANIEFHAMQSIVTPLLDRRYVSYIIINRGPLQRFMHVLDFWVYQYYSRCTVLVNCIKISKCN